MKYNGYNGLNTVEDSQLKKLVSWNPSTIKIQALHRKGYNRLLAVSTRQERSSQLGFRTEGRSIREDRGSNEGV